MEEQQNAVWVWSSATQVAPHQLRVYPLRAAGASALAASFVALAAFSVLSTIPPHAAPASPPVVALASLKIIGWAVSGGHLFPVQAPQILHAIGGMVGGLKALAALAFGALAARKIWAWGITPRDGYEHARGGRVYKFDEAQRVLKRQLKQEKK